MSDNHEKQQDQIKQMKQMIHSATVKSRWYALHPEMLLPELVAIAVKTTTVAATLLILGVL